MEIYDIRNYAVNNFSLLFMHLCLFGVNTKYVTWIESDELTWDYFLN